jgi:hypothetical protein
MMENDQCNHQKQNIDGKHTPRMEAVGLFGPSFFAALESGRLDIFPNVTCYNTRNEIMIQAQTVQTYLNTIVIGQKPDG